MKIMLNIYRSDGTNIISLALSTSTYGLYHYLLVHYRLYCQLLELEFRCVITFINIK